MWPGILFLLKDEVLRFLGSPQGEFMAVVPVGYAARVTGWPKRRPLETIVKFVQSESRGTLPYIEAQIEWRSAGTDSGQTGGILSSWSPMPQIRNSSRQPVAKSLRKSTICNAESVQDNSL